MHRKELIRIKKQHVEELKSVNKDAKSELERHQDESRKRISEQKLDMIDLEADSKRKILEMERKYDREVNPKPNRNPRGSKTGR